jgi:hypothetical protein
MDHAAKARLIDHVFQGDEPVYAMLDAARGREVYDAILSCGMRYECLYDGKLSDALAEVAPYLVRLRAGHPFTDELLDDGWGKSWGCLVSTPLPIRELRSHLRRFLRVQTEDGKTLLFRFYDPRVLRAYLPTCTSEEIETFMGPVTRYMMEDTGGSSALTFEKRNASLSFAKTPLNLAS